MFDYIIVNEELNLNLRSNYNSKYNFISIKYLHINKQLENLIKDLNKIFKMNNLNIELKELIISGGYSLIYNVNDLDIAKICFLNNFKEKNYLEINELLLKHQIIPDIYSIINIKNELLIIIMKKYQYDLLSYIEYCFNNIILHNEDLNIFFNNLLTYINKYLELINKILELNYVSSDFKLENSVLNITDNTIKLIDIDEMLCIKYEHNKLSLIFCQLLFKFNILAKLYVENCHINYDYMFKILSDKFIFFLIENLFDSSFDESINYIIENKNNLFNLIYDLENCNIFYSYKIQYINFLEINNIKNLHNISFYEIFIIFIKYIHTTYNNNFYQILFNKLMDIKLNIILSSLAKLMVI